jgi:hypothetical protein
MMMMMRCRGHSLPSFYFMPAKHLAAWPIDSLTHNRHPSFSAQRTGTTVQPLVPLFTPSEEHHVGRPTQKRGQDSFLPLPAAPPPPPSSHQQCGPGLLYAALLLLLLFVVLLLLLFLPGRRQKSGEYVLACDR